jgi:hypothetical protein
MNEKKKYNGLRWALFVPLQLVLSIIIMSVIQWIPIVWIVNALFDLGDANPLKTKEVSGPVGFLLVYILSSISLFISAAAAIWFTSKPKLAWKILWMIQLLPILFLVFLYEITGENGFRGDLWFNIAEIMSLLTAAVVTFFMLEDAD